MERPPGELLEFLRRYPPAIQSLTLGVRRLIHAEVAPCHEHIFNMPRTVVIVYSATSKVIADGICVVTAWRQHVTLGFSRGVDLADPAGVLRGAGKAMRHVRLNTLEDVGRREIRALLRRARRHAGIVRRRGVEPEVVTTVKKKSTAATFTWP
ncbi:MAG TPA: DUF1801 domain-containing protein [Vicinamibacterales bacterium]|nr:DUF1801 domain-containing protein [Vicinamibacterales bacterium]